MNILFIKQRFDPEVTFKGLKFLQELEKKGHKIQVIAGFPLDSNNNFYKSYKNRIFTIEKIGNIKIIRLFVFTNIYPLILERLINYFGFMLLSFLTTLF